MRMSASTAAKLRSALGPLLVMCLVFTVYAAYDSYRIRQDLASGVVKCGDKVMPDDDDLRCSEDASAARFGGGQTRDQVKADNEEQASRGVLLAGLGGVGAL